MHRAVVQEHCVQLMKARIQKTRSSEVFMSNVLDIEFNTMEGETTTLRQLGGSKWLVVNVASACGATPQYAGLQTIYESNEELTVVGFPCNQFGRQEPGTHEEICEFTSTKYHVTFPLMAKIDVNGEQQIPLYSELCKVEDSTGHSGEIRWNFEKFLIDNNGKIQRYSTRVLPSDIALE
jgi:glutathione peroxidase